MGKKQHQPFSANNCISPQSQACAAGVSGESLVHGARTDSASVHRVRVTKSFFISLCSYWVFGVFFNELRRKHIHFGFVYSMVQ